MVRRSYKEKEQLRLLSLKETREEGAEVREEGQTVVEPNKLKPAQTSWRRLLQLCLWLPTKVHQRHPLKEMNTSPVRSQPACSVAWTQYPRLGSATLFFWSLVSISWFQEHPPCLRLKDSSQAWLSTSKGHLQPRDPAHFVATQETKPPRRPSLLLPQPPSTTIHSVRSQPNQLLINWTPILPLFKPSSP